MRRNPWTFLALCLGLVLPACGGGGGGAVPVAAPQAQVLGVVATNDGSTALVDGIQVLVPETGDVTTTDGGGGFSLRAPAGRTFRLRFRAIDGTLASSLDDDVDESDDDTPDGSDIDGDEIEIGPLAEGETCDVEIELKDGNVVGAWIERHHEGWDDDGGESLLLPPEGADALARGEAELEREDGCLEVEIEVDGLEALAIYEVELWHPDGGETLLDGIEVDEEGEGRLVVTWCDDDVLPFEAASFADLAGVEVVVVDADGNVVLRGKLPGRGGHHEERDHARIVWDLQVPEGGAQPDAEGAVILRFEDGCLRVVIEVGHVTPSTMLDAVLVPPAAAEVPLGELEVDELGMGRLVLELCDDDDDLPALPFEGPADVLGTVLELRDGDGAVVLRGEVPEIELPPEFPPLDPAEIGHALLEAPPGSTEADAWGKVFVATYGDQGVLLLSAKGFATTYVLDVVLSCEGSDAILGQVEIGAEGCGTFAWEHGPDSDPLPFEATALGDYAGCTLSLTTATGDVLLAGTFPALVAKTGDGHEGGAD